MDKSEIKYISLLAPLFYLYGTIFLWAKNAHMFNLSQFAYSFVVILAVAVIFYFIVFLVLRILCNKIKYNKAVQIGVALSVSVLLGLIGQFCFLKTIFFPYHHAVMWGIITFIFFVIYFNFTQKLLVFLSILLFFASSSFIYNFYTASVENNKVKDAIEANTNDKYLVKFKDNPNIYLFYLESFHGTRTLKNVFHAEVTPFIDYLNNQNFSVCKNMYSSSNNTLDSMKDVYSLGKSQLTQSKNSDALSAIRELLGGGEGNNLLKVLKYNGYTTNILTDTFYYFYYKGKYLDYNYMLDNFNSPYFITLLPSYLFTRIKLEGDIINNFWNKNIRDLRSLKQQVENEITKMQKNGSPYFLAWKGGAFHVQFATYNYNRDKEQFISRYKKVLENKIIKETQEIISMILKKDENALIVMLGDHGSYIYFGINNVLKELSANQLTYNDWIDSHFNVFSAVRLPKKYKKFSFNDNSGIYLNHSNMFIHIFSLLAEDPEYLKLQKIPLSNCWGRPIMKNAKIINELQ